MGYEWVPVLKPGKYRLADKRVVTYTPSDGKNVVSQLKEQLKTRLRVPICWMHDPDAQPYHLSHQPEKARQFIGELVDAKVENGLSFVKCFFPDEKDHKQFKKVNGVSPCLIRDWTDETGKTWPGLSIFHLAVTPQPIQRDLPRPSEYRETATPAYLGHSSPSACHRFAGRLEVLSHTLPGGKAMADEKDDDTKADDETPAEESAEPTPEVETVDEKRGGQAAQLAEVVSILAEMGIHVDHATNMKELIVALKTAQKMQSGEGAVNDTENLSDDTNTEAVQQPAMLMSHQLLPAQMKAGATIGLAQRLDKIKSLANTARITKPMADDLLKRHNAESVAFAAENLSHESVGVKFGPDGLLLPTELDAEIRAYEKLPAGKFVKTDNLSHTAAVAEPEDKAAKEREAVSAQMIEAAKKVSV